MTEFEDRVSAAAGSARLARPRLLVVDDDLATIAILTSALSPYFVVHHAGNGAAALEMLHTRKYLLLISDVMMPVMDGFALLAAIRSDNTLSGMPVVMMTADGKPDNEIKALGLGAVDIIRKPFVTQILIQRIKNIRDITEAAQLAAQNRIYQNAIDQQRVTLTLLEHDALTGLLNRTAFYRRAGDMLKIHGKAEGKKYTIIRFDIDAFAIFNESAGTAKGDELLKYLAEFMRRRCPRGSIYGRLESDNFAVLMESASADPRELFESFQNWATAFDHAYKISMRAGVYPVEDTSADPAIMCDRALLALRSIKNDFSKHMAWYDDSMRSALLRGQKLAEEMQPAIASRQFLVYYQPQIDYSTGAIVGAEALVRWNHPKMGLLPPGDFIPIFESNGMILQLDSYVWEQTCKALRKWINIYGERTIPVSVNVSRIEIYRRDLCTTLTSLVKKYGIPAHMLRLEITESAYVKNADTLQSTVKELKDAGFTIEMDDFGSAYSSLNMLKDIPVDILKLDMKFLAGSDPQTATRGGNILSSIVRMARWLRLPVIAEGIETKEQADYLKSIGCIYMQGYYFSRPVPHDDYEKLFAAGKGGGLDKYKGVSFDAAEHFWDLSTQTALIFNNLLGGAALIERTGDKLELIRANDPLFSAFRTTREKFAKYATDIQQLLPPDSYTKFMDTLSSAAESGNEQEINLRCLPTNGAKNLWVRCRVRLLAKNVGSEMFFSGVENIDAKVALDIQLANQKKLSHRLFNELPCAVVAFRIKAGRLKFINCNTTACTLLGFKSRHEFGKHFSEHYGCRNNSIILDSDIDTFNFSLKRTMEEGIPSACECRLKCQTGSYRWFDIRFYRTSDGADSEILQTAFADIDDKKRMETEKYDRALLSVYNEAFLFDFGSDICYTVTGDERYSYTGRTSHGLRSVVTEWTRNRIAEDDRVKFAAFFNPTSLIKTTDSENVRTLEYRWKLPGGNSTVWERGFAVRADASHVLVCCKNITYDKLFENAVMGHIAELETSNCTNRAKMLEGIPAGVFVSHVSRDSKITPLHINSRIYDLFGYDKSSQDTSEKLRDADKIYAMLIKEIEPALQNVSAGDFTVPYVKI